MPRSVNLRKLLAFGTGVGIEIGEKDLEVVVARVRPSGIRVLGRTVIADFRTRPAAEWGAECSAFAKRLGAGHLSATVLLPRAEIIVRQLALPGVAAKDLGSAISFQMDSLHPYGEDEVMSGWRPLGKGQVLIGIIRRDAFERYTGMFAEAGIPVATLTFSASVLHGALRLTDEPPAEGFAAVCRSASGGVEIYGESPNRPLFSAEFELPAARALGLAAAELRLPPEEPAARLENLLPAPAVNPIDNDLSRNALPYATALAGACPWLAPAANLLPPEQRVSASRAVFVPTAALAGLVLVVAFASLAFSAFEDRRYLAKLEAEIRTLEPKAQRAAALDRQIDRTRNRARMLDEFRGHTRADLEAMNELTHLLPPPIWTTGLDLTRDSATLQGEAEQAASLIKTIDASPFFQNSEFTVISKVGNAEMFRIRTQREAHK